MHLALFVTSIIHHPESSHDVVGENNVWPEKHIQHRAWTLNVQFYPDSGSGRKPQDSANSTVLAIPSLITPGGCSGTEEHYKTV